MILVRITFSTYSILDYQDLLSQTPVIGVWDDHDYGHDDADHSFPMKHVNREIYLDFIGEPLTTKRRQEKHRGIYQDYIVMAHDDIKVHIILLDVRFHYSEDI